VVIPNRDEFGLLAKAVNQMSTAIAHRFEDLKRRSRQLEESGERLSTVLGGMIEGVVAVDDRERILFANKAARFMLELAGSNVIGRPIWEVVRNPTVQEVVRTALAGTTHRSVEFELPRTQSAVALLATRLPGDPCPGVVLVLHDVTELRRLENLRREFVSNVSHELKTPLTSIQAYTETLLNGAIDDPTHNREFLRRIEDQADRLHKLILDLLRLARIESGQDVFEVTAVPLGRVVQACVEHHATIADSKGVILSAEAPNERIRVHAGAEGLRTIMDNLIDNAIKYTPQGGSVAVRWWAEGSMAVIEVEDTGIGIAKMHQTRIFERFYRADKARSREFGGTGLGLSIVKHLTQVFEGTVDVESDPGKGSTFTVRLPRV
jgi:two-component system phosphate regulon sensor histidine kinase PhoR